MHLVLTGFSQAGPSKSGAHLHSLGAMQKPRFWHAGTQMAAARTTDNRHIDQHLADVPFHLGQLRTLAVGHVVPVSVRHLPDAVLAHHRLGLCLIGKLVILQTGHGAATGQRHQVSCQSKRWLDIGLSLFLFLFLFILPRHGTL